MCFAPPRRALFRHRNSQKWSEHGVSCTFWLGNVLRATTACTFSTSQLPKMFREWCVLYTFWLRNVLRATTGCNFSSLISLASLLFDWARDGGNFDPSHLASQPLWQSGWVAEWPGWMTNFLPLVANDLCRKTFRYIRNLKPRKVFHYSHCPWHDVAASEFVLAPSEFSILCWLRFAMTLVIWCYLYVVFQHAMEQANYIQIHAISILSSQLHANK